jgi:hypothetical protein
VERKRQSLTVLQVNLQNGRVSLADLCVVMRKCDVALIQEHWTYKGKLKD